MSHAVFNLVIFTLIQYATSGTGPHTDEKDCMCAVFMEEKITGQSQPIYSIKVFEPGCYSTAGEICKNMCTNLATMAEEKAPAMLCSVLQGKMDPFKPAIFWRNCGSEWIFSGLASSDFIACVDGKPLLND